MMDLLDTITLFGTVVIAAPIGLLGVEFLLGGRLFVGSGFLAIAVALVVGGYFKPSLKGIVIDTVTDTVADVVIEEPDDETGSRDGEAYKD